MIDYLELSCTPCNEDCQQVGTDSYDPTIARLECRVFADQLRRQFGEHDNARFVIRGNSHDFGTYYEVAVRFDANDDSAADYAYRVESELPEHWDAIALEQLKKNAELSARE